MNHFIETEKLTILGRIIYPWAIKYRNDLVLQNIPKSTNSLLDFGGGIGYIVDNIGCEKAISIDEQGDIFIKRNDTGEITNKTISEGTVFVNKLHFKDASFDCVTAVAVIEHLKEPEILINEIHRVLKSNGFFIMTTPKRIVDSILPFLDKGSSQLRGKKVQEEHEHYFNFQSMNKLTHNLFSLHKYQTFQLSINQLFVYKKNES